MKVLLVDDDRDIADLVSIHLSRSTQYDLQSAQSAKGALLLIDEAIDPYDCFLVDIQMPGVDGISLVQLIREIPHHQNTPIVMLTAMTDKGYLDRAFFAGATDYVTKPIDFQELHERLTAARDLTVSRARHYSGYNANQEVDFVSDEARRNSPSAHVPLHGIGSAIEYAEFKNYLRQLQSRRLFMVPTLAVKIHNSDAIQAESTPEEFEALVRNVAVAVEETFMSQGGILTYRGSGVFFCVPRKRLKGHRRALERALNRKHLSSHTSDCRSVRLLVGDQVQLRIESEASVPEMLDRALVTADRPDVVVREIHQVRDTFVKRQRMLLGE